MSYRNPFRLLLPLRLLRTVGGTGRLEHHCSASFWLLICPEEAGCQTRACGCYCLTSFIGSTSFRGFVQAVRMSSMYLSYVTEINSHVCYHSKVQSASEKTRSNTFFGPWDFSSKRAFLEGSSQENTVQDERALCSARIINRYHTAEERTHSLYFTAHFTHHFTTRFHSNVTHCTL